MSHSFKYGIDTLSVAKVLDIAAGKVKGVLVPEAIDRINASAGYVQSIVSQHTTVYGINTGFGPLCDTKISEEDTRTLQYNILQSHSVGVGDSIPEEISRIMLITKVHALAQGFSGAALATLERIIWHIENRVTPCVPEKGSVGASGDLAPLSHLFLPLIGLGKVWYKGQVTDMQQVFRQEQLKSVALGPKEGLALINGTQFILSFAVKAVSRLHNALEAADIIGALSLEGLMGTAKPFDPRLHDIRPYPGNKLVAHRLKTMLDNSEIMASHIDCGRVQDPYSLRCMPQVHGASRTAWEHLNYLTGIELNAVTDNPIIFSAEDTISGGNFHGQPMALPLDYATVAAAELGNISDRRCYMMIEGRYGLPKLLIQDAGLNSGFMIPQYTTAALVTENKTLCFPASADSVPTSLGQEDHVSMGSISGRKLNQVIGNLEYILAIELLYAAQAVDFRRPLKSGPILEAVHAFTRQHVTFADKDRIFATDIEALHKIITNQSLVNVANEAAANSQLSLNGIYHEQFGLY
ncbi:histidine ammonia-lyase [Chitinophaga sp. Cy-1792]|uniref:histidine ammonia-lyase n=1 Tax=Chitinophaga sp. Cy-1792 TaxID=2608339 RepID=UPI00141E73C5|nr:histidine ammonia-lyase [Chitinophaga sp. Cy-1792]NIG53626.1 histidine ammonia-lyase [Chitinophaga sp. Cy-1792]